MPKRLPSRGPAPVGDPERATSESLPLTGFATLGLLSPNEGFTAIEVQERAHRQLRHFYWTPALSHIRRELNRLEGLGYVDATVVQQGRVKRTLKYRITDLGSKALSEWAERPEDDPFIIKNAVILRLWLGRRADNADLVLQALERHIEHVQDALASLTREIEESERRFHERAEGPVERNPDSFDLLTYIERAAWNRGVLEYCRRGYEDEIRNATMLRAELQSAATAKHEDPSSAGSPR